MFKGFASLYSLVFLCLGILGFIPSLTPDSYLFGFLKVNNAINIIYIMTGMAAGWMIFVQQYFRRVYFQILGFIYGVISVLGFIYGETSILGFVANCPGSTWFHVIVSVNSMLIGFGTQNNLEKTNERN